MTSKITSGLFAQGSFGLQKINPNNGVRIGHMIRVWSVGDRHFLTRQEARNFIWDLEFRAVHGDADKHVLDPRFVP